MRIGPFFTRRQVWVPTWRACLLAGLAVAALVVAGIRFTPRFLAPNQPIHGEVLAVEGWSSDQTLQTGARLAKEGGYKLIVSTGGPIEKGMNISSYQTFANLGAARMREFGVTGTNLIYIPAPLVARDRTYHSALALKTYLERHTPYRTIDLLSTGVHSRRSWLLYQRASGPEFKVGIIADTDPAFDLRRWWKTSNGVRNVISELIGYVYVHLSISPD